MYREPWMQEEKEIPIPTQRRARGWQKDALLDGQTYHGSKRPGLPEKSGDWRYWETCRTRIPRISRKPRNFRKFRSLGNRRKIWPYHFQKSLDCVPHMDKIFTIVRRRCGRSPSDQMNDLDVNTTLWCIFMSVSL